MDVVDLADTVAVADMVVVVADIVLAADDLDGIVEAIRLGRPVLTGPHMFNFRDMMADLQARGGITIVSNREEFEAHYPAPPPAQSLLEALADESNKPLEATLAALGTLLDARQE